MLKLAIGHSNDPDSLVAIEEALENCVLELGESIPQAGILLAAIDFDRSLILQQILEKFPNIELIGGTTDGEISSILGFQQNSLILGLFVAEGVDIKAGIGHQVSQYPENATRQAVEQALAKSSLTPQLCLTFPEGLLAGGVSIVEGLGAALGKSVPIVGGLTADQWRLEKTYQFYRDQVFNDAVPILIFSGNLSVSSGVASGWSPIGQKAKITKVRKNIVYEIDGKPALEFYHYYLGGLSPSQEYPLAVFDEQEQQYYMRAPSIYDADTGSITFFAEIPEQATVQITQTSREAILAACESSITNALSAYPGTEPEAAMFFSCASRRQILGTRTRKECEIARSFLPEILPFFGFYAHGEIAPLETAKATRFHNETFITVLLGTK